MRVAQSRYASNGLGSGCLYTDPFAPRSRTPAATVSCKCDRSSSVPERKVLPVTLQPWPAKRVDVSTTTSQRTSSIARWIAAVSSVAPSPWALYCCTSQGVPARPAPAPARMCSGDGVAPDAPGSAVERRNAGSKAIATRTEQSHSLLPGIAPDQTHDPFSLLAPLSYSPYCAKGSSTYFLFTRGTLGNDVH